MGDFEFGIDLLISLMEARLVLWDKTGDMEAWRKVCICLQEDFEALVDVPLPKKNAFVE